MKYIHIYLLLVIILGFFLTTSPINAATNLNAKVTNEQASWITNKLIKYTLIPEDARKETQKVIKKMTVGHIMWWADKLYWKNAFPIDAYTELRLLFGVDSQDFKNSPVKIAITSPNGGEKIKLSNINNKKFTVEWISKGLPADNPVDISIFHENGAGYVLGTVNLDAGSFSAYLDANRIVGPGNYRVCMDTPVPNKQLSHYSDCADGYIYIK